MRPPAPGPPTSAAFSTTDPRVAAIPNEWGRGTERRGARAADPRVWVREAPAPRRHFRPGRRRGHRAGDRMEPGRSRRAWPPPEGGGERGWVGPTWDTPRLPARRRRGPPAPRPLRPPRAPPPAHLPRPASRAWRPRRSVPPLPRSVLGSRARFPLRLGAMGECGPADGLLPPRRPTGGPGGSEGVARAVGAGPAPGRALLEPGRRRPLHPGLAAAAGSSPLPPRCSAPTSGKKGHRLGRGQTHGQR